MKNNFIDIFLSGLIFILAVLILNPLHFWMPTALLICLLAVLFVIFCIYAVYLFREKPSDEREELHSAMSGKIAFLSGASVLIIAISAQIYNDMLDSWLIITLLSMVIVKMASRIWYEWKR